MALLATTAEAVHVWQLTMRYYLINKSITLITGSLIVKPNKVKQTHTKIKTLRLVHE